MPVKPFCTFDNNSDDAMQNRGIQFLKLHLNLLSFKKRTSLPLLMNLFDLNFPFLWFNNLNFNYNFEGEMYYII